MKKLFYSLAFALWAAPFLFAGSYNLNAVESFSSTEIIFAQDSITWYLDTDGDGYGLDDNTVIANEMPSGYALLAGDCDDQNPQINPIAAEICGNILDENCDGLIQVDTLSPIALCKGVVKFYVNDTGVAIVEPMLLDNGSYDDCSVQLSFSVDTPSYNCAGIGVHFVQLTVTDQSGNSNSCSTIVKIADNTPPVAVCNTKVKAYLDFTGKASITAAALNNGSYDNCGEIVNYRIDTSSFTCSQLGEFPLSLYVEDAAGFVSDCQSLIQVSDTLAPVIICPDVFSMALNHQGEAHLPANVLDQGTYDNCSTALDFSLDVSEFDCDDLGSLPVTLFATDASGNQNECTTTLSVVDKLAPTVICAENYTLKLDENGEAILEAQYLDQGSYDNCSSVLNFSLGKSLFTCDDLGEQPVVLSVSDDFDNIRTCTTLVLVIDKEAPVAQCKSQISMALEDNGLLNVKFADLDNGSSDNCLIESFVIEPAQFSQLNVGWNEVSMKLADGSGNESNCQTMVEILGLNTSEVSEIRQPLLTVFPNPSTGMFYWQMAQALICETLELTDINGKILLTEKPVSGQNLLDLSAQPNGIYFLKTQSGARVQISKLCLLH